MAAPPGVHEISVVKAYSSYGNSQQPEEERMPAPASTLERDIDRLSPADRWRLLRWIAGRNPTIVRDGIRSLPSLRKADIVVLSWALREPEEQAAEDMAG
jgi:hypothetical protein